jgi:predicted transcriptional regulator
MELADYRKWKGLSLDAIAKEVGMSNASAVLKHETGQVMPKAAIIDRYREMTNGAVTAEDFVRVVLRYQSQQSKAA